MLMGRNCQSSTVHVATVTVQQDPFQAFELFYFLKTYKALNNTNFKGLCYEEELKGYRCKAISDIVPTYEEELKGYRCKAITDIVPTYFQKHVEEKKGFQLFVPGLALKI